METILKIRDICKEHHSCYDNCPFHVDNECVLSIPPANWSDGDLYLIGKAVGQEPKMGRWIDKDEKSAVCSCCNRNNTLYGDFCKWCGAKLY